MKIYIQFNHSLTNEIIAGEIHVKKKYKFMKLIERIQEFAISQGSCPSYAVSTCLYKIY